MPNDTTPRLNLDQLVSLQELNAVTWNEALAQIDALVDLYLLGQFVNTPPTTPQDGDCYLTGGAPTGAWSGYAYKIASCLDGAWRFYAPFNGLRAYVATSGAFIVYWNGIWTDWNSLISANEVSVASAATCDLGAAGSLFVQITGSTTITSFGTGANKLRFVRFAGALTLTQNATTLVLLGGANRATAAGDVGVYASDASGNWRERSYVRAASDAGDYATKTGTETLSNKTLSSPAVSGTIAGSISQYQSGSDNNLILNSAGRYTALYFQHGGASRGQWYWDETNYAMNMRTVGAAGSLVFCTGASGTTALTLSSAQDAVFAGNVVPSADNVKNIGSASYRFSTVFAATGTINTSGAATKTNVHALSAAESIVAKALAANVRVFQFCDAVVKKGADKARLHIGMIYEDVVAAFAAQGLDPLRYGIVCRDPAMKTVTKTRIVENADGDKTEESYDTVEPDLDEAGAQKWVLGLRYGELAQFVMAGLAARIAALEAA